MLESEVEAGIDRFVVVAVVFVFTLSAAPEAAASLEIFSSEEAEALSRSGSAGNCCAASRLQCATAASPLAVADSNFVVL